MATNLLLSSVETAFASLISAGIGSLANVYTGKASTNKILPAVICFADGSDAEEDPPLTGNFWVSVEIQVKSTAATEVGGTDPKPGDLALVKTVFDLVKVDNLDDLLNAQGQDLTVFPRGYFFMTPKCGFDELGGWTDVLPVKLYCCASVLAP